jgi:hypothetical protein
MFQAIIIAGLVLSLVACAGSPEPLLRSNAKFQLQGRQAAQLDVAMCQRKAEASGLKPGTENRSGNVAAGAGLGLISGAAAGASAGLIAGLAGVTIGAAAGAALGVIIGSVGGAYRPLEPDPPCATVVHYLAEKGMRCLGGGKGGETERWLLARRPRTIRRMEGWPGRPPCSRACGLRPSFDAQ